MNHSSLNRSNTQRNQSLLQMSCPFLSKTFQNLSSYYKVYCAENFVAVHKHVLVFKPWQTQHYWFSLQSVLEEVGIFIE